MYKTLLLSLSAILLATAQFAIAETSKPNVLVILADDLGWRDLGCTGSTFYETPAIDDLASQGACYSHAYAPHPVCGPSRAAILTGKAPLRINNHGVIGKVLKEEVTIAEAFKEAGYTTFFAGKWHCGVSPSKQGFDETVADNHEGQPGSYYYPYKDTGMDWPGLKRRIIKSRNVPGLDDGKEGEYLTDRLTDETIKFIEKNKDKPFLAYLCHYAVHAPMESKKEYEEYFAEKAAKLPPIDQAYKSQGSIRFKQRQDYPVYAGMIKSLDDSVGRLVNCLKENRLFDNTIIVFLSDNGGVAAHRNRKIKHLPTSNLPLRAGKGYCYDGGTRIPFIISYPAVIKAGKVIEDKIIGMDLYPTLLELCGLPPKPEQHMDGVSLVSSLQGQTPDRDTFFWSFPHPHGSGHRRSSAILYKNYKMIQSKGGNKQKLYDISVDPGELNDISAEHVELTQTIKWKLDEWLAEHKKR